MGTIGFKEIFSSSGTVGLRGIKFFDYTLGSLIARILPEQPLKEPKAVISNILVIRPGGIGDAVFLLPVFKAIKAKHPEARIDVLCQRRNAQVFSSQGQLVDRVFVFGSLIDMKEVLLKRYTIVLDTEQWHYLSAVTASLVRADMRIGFASRVGRAKFFNRSIDYSMDAYELDNFWALFSGLVKKEDEVKNIKGCFSLSQNLIFWAKKQIPANCIALSVGASVPERRLSTVQLVNLGQGLLRRGFCPVFLGGPDALLQTKEVMESMHDTRVFNFVGQTNLVESTALISQSRAFIGTDSGLMHLAAGVGTRVIAIFGAGNMKKWAPRGPEHASVSENVPCSPCNRFGYGLPTCQGSFHCIRQMDMEGLLNAYL